MKKSRETQIILDALAHSGFEVTDRMVFAVNFGLKQIRREKFEEREGGHHAPLEENGGAAAGGAV